MQRHLPNLAEPPRDGPDACRYLRWNPGKCRMVLTHTGLNRMQWAESDPVMAIQAGGPCGGKGVPVWLHDGSAGRAVSSGWSYYCSDDLSLLQLTSHLSVSVCLTVVHGRLRWLWLWSFPNQEKLTRDQTRCSAKALSGLLCWLPRWRGGEKSPRRHKLIPWVGKIPWSRKWQPTPEDSIDRGAWWATVTKSHKELDATEWLSPGANK